jgi:hypothetical protein
MLGGFLVPDDARALLGLAPLPNGEGANLSLPMNSVLLQQALKQLQDSQSQQDAVDDAAAQNGDGQ